MKMWKKCGISLVTVAGLSTALQAQVPAVPAAPAAATPAAAAAPGAAGAAAGAGGPIRGLFAMLCNPELKAKKKEKLCAIPLVKLLDNTLKPISALSGGLLPSCCPEVKPSDLAKPADSAEGAAARIKADEAAAKERRAAVKYLATVDCNYWPEAQEALINALRADRNECVRFEAAMAFSRGCCCNRATIMALILTVTGRTDDGNPPENSERVKAAARAALEHCVGCHVEVVRISDKKGVEPGKEPKPAEKPKDPIGMTPSGKVTPTAFYKQCHQLDQTLVWQEAQRVLKSAPVRPTSARPGSRSIAGIIKGALTGSTPVETPVPATVAPPTVVENGVRPVAHVEPKKQVAPVQVPMQEKVVLNPPVSDPRRLSYLARHSSYPDEREWAVNALATMDPHQHGEVSFAIVAATGDVSPSVREAALRAILKLRLRDAKVMSAVQKLQSDPDGTVRMQAAHVMKTLFGQQASTATPGLSTRQ